ncbi:hypothetical protein ANCCEY_02760 [Ancylostoma ceylanicum]|uniref:Uncharacterized protein n=1 Tax=Ancylostoma ceylanicum TaxID=53326 RepID=A0A0D6M1G1_9BILA|nr:hypothetical protein ANCCEY_02760 [Ancylostoma ceylanicum]
MAMNRETFFLLQNTFLSLISLSTLLVLATSRLGKALTYTVDGLPTFACGFGEIFGLTQPEAFDAERRLTVREKVNSGLRMQEEVSVKPLSRRARYKAKSKIGLYKWMMVIATTFDIVFSTLTAFSCPTIAAISQKSSVLFVKGGFMLPYASHFPALFESFSWLFYQQRNPYTFRKQWLSVYGGRVFFVFTIPISLAMSAAIMLIFASYPSADDITEFKDIAFQINLNAYRAFLVACLNPQRDEEVARAAVLVAACANLMLILVCSLLAMIICSRLMVTAVKEAVSSQRAMRLQQQLQKTLTFQKCAVHSAPSKQYQPSSRQDEAETDASTSQLSYQTCVGVAEHTI